MRAERGEGGAEGREGGADGLVARADPAEGRLSRMEPLVGAEGLRRLAGARVMVLGLGGVGGA